MNSRRSHTSSSSNSKSVQKQGIKKKLKTNITKQRVYVEENPWCLKRANEIARNLPPGSISFIKQMLYSNVVRGFWFGIPVDFCKDYLPKCNETMILEVGENGENRHHVKYLVNKSGLSGRWKGFAMAHELKMGDFLVFHLLSACIFKVHIVRVSEFNGEPKRTEEEEEVNEVESDYDDDEDKLPLANVFKMKKRKLNDVTEFEDFRIIVDGRVLGDSLIPARTRKKYFELCKSQEIFLHKNLENGLGCEFVAQLVSGMVAIADGIRAARDTSNFKAYCTSLESYERYGMSVGFLRTRIDEMMGLTCEWGGCNKSIMNKFKVDKDVFRGIKAEIEDLNGSVQS